MIRSPRPWPRVRWASFRLFLRLRHQILGRRYRRLDIEHVDGVYLVVLPNVFNPVHFRTGVLLARSISDVARPLTPPRGAEPRALDMGTGSGIAAIFAARLGYRVIGVDVNPEAVRCARINALASEFGLFFAEPRTSSGS